MSTDYITALYLVGGLIVGFLLSSVICLYIIKFISAPKRTAKNPRRKMRVGAGKKTEEEPMPKEEVKSSNPIREKLASQYRQDGLSAGRNVGTGSGLSVSCRPLNRFFFKRKQI